MRRKMILLIFSLIILAVLLYVLVTIYLAPSGALDSKRRY